MPASESKMKVLIGPSTFAAGDKTPLNKLEESGFEVIDNPFKRRLTKEELLNLLSKDITGLIAGLEPLDRDVLSRSKLKVISRCGSGMSNVDLKAAKELAIKVFSIPDAPVSSVAELTVGALLCLLRQLLDMSADLHQGRWSKKIGCSLEGKTVLIIGFGRIGRKVASLLKAFGVKLIAVDTRLSSDIGKSIDGVAISSLEEALPKADIITIHTNSEDKVIGPDEFKIIKKGIFLLNSARGGVVDEGSLIQALEQDKIKGAWIDVFDNEPYSGKLIKYPQVILSPHVGSYTEECRKNMEIESVNNLIAGFKQE